MKKEKLDDAISFYNKVIEMKPDYAHAYCSKGIALRVKGNLDESENCHKKAIKLKQITLKPMMHYPQLYYLKVIMKKLLSYPNGDGQPNKI